MQLSDSLRDCFISKRSTIERHSFLIEFRLLILLSTLTFKILCRCIADKTIDKERGAKACKPNSRPDLGVIELQLFSLFGAGITMSTWTWTSNTLSTWKTAWDR